MILVVWRWGVDRGCVTSMAIGSVKVHRRRRRLARWVGAVGGVEIRVGRAQERGDYGSTAHFARPIISKIRAKSLAWHRFYLDHGSQLLDPFAPTAASTHTTRPRSS